jgi:hypothetical protein
VGETEDGVGLRALELAKFGWLFSKMEPGKVNESFLKSGLNR